MILVPVIATAMIGLVCVGFLWFALIHGMGIGIHDQEEFEVVCTAISEGAKECLEEDSDFSSIEAILDGVSAVREEYTQKGLRIRQIWSLSR